MIGVIPIDSIFSPVLRAKYEVSDIRVGNELDHDQLSLEVWTNGSISAADAIGTSAKIMINYLEHFTHIAKTIQSQPALTATFGGYAEVQPEEPEGLDFSKSTIEELDLSVRAFNCLKRASINSIADLLDKTIEDLEKVRNLGKKSIEEIEVKLENHHNGPLYLKKKGE